MFRPGPTAGPALTRCGVPTARQPAPPRGTAPPPTGGRGGGCGPFLPAARGTFRRRAPPPSGEEVRDATRRGAPGARRTPAYLSAARLEAHVCTVRRPVPVPIEAARARRARSRSRSAACLMSTHIPIRPGWLCAGCAVDWPCPTRRRQLLAEYGGAPVSLALYLGACFVDAAGDLRDVPAGDLHARFFAWFQRQSRETPSWHVPGLPARREVRPLGGSPVNPDTA